MVQDLPADLRRPGRADRLMHRSLVEENRWIGERRFLHALSYCTLLPGPEAQQLAIYIGWLLNGARGGPIAGTLFVLPGVVALLALSATYAAFVDTGVVTALFTGLAAAVLAIVAQAVIKVAKRALALHHRALVPSPSPRSWPWPFSTCLSPRWLRPRPSLGGP